MSSEWPWVSLADAPLEIMDGDRGTNYPSQNDFLSLGHCLFLNTGNVTTEGFNFSSCAFISAEKDSALRKGKLKRGDVVLTTRGTVGNVAYYQDDIPFEHVRINSGMVILRSEQSQLSSHFLYLFVRSNLFIQQVKSLQSGSAQPQLPIRDMKRIEMPIPSLSEQAAICEAIGSIDDRISLLRETIATLEAIAQALFKSWFVDFDPVRAKTEGRLPEGMDAATAALFPDAFEETELGLVPRGWSVKCLSVFITESTRRIGDEAAVVLSAVQTGNLVMSSDFFNKRVHSKDISKYKAVEPYSYAYNPSRINIGSIGINEMGVVGAVSPIYVVANPKNISFGYYLWHLLRTNRIRESIKTMSSGTVRQSLAFKDFASIKVALPADEIVNQFFEVRDEIFKNINLKENQISVLSNLRDTLLPHLISGQLRIANAEAELEKAMA